jgi:hypothetical protein
MKYLVAAIIVLFATACTQMRAPVHVHVYQSTPTVVDNSVEHKSLF